MKSIKSDVTMAKRKHINSCEFRIFHVFRSENWNVYSEDNDRSCATDETKNMWEIIFFVVGKFSSTIDDAIPQQRRCALDYTYGSEVKHAQHTTNFHAFKLK